MRSCHQLRSMQTCGGLTQDQLGLKDISEAPLPWQALQGLGVSESALLTAPARAVAVEKWGLGRIATPTGMHLWSEQVKQAWV